MAMASEEMMPQSQAELMDVFGACLPAVAQSLQSMQKRTDQNENPDSSQPKRPRTDPKDVEMEPTARQKAGPPRRGQHRRGNQTFGNSSGGLERLVVNMASLCLRQEEELQLMRVDKQFMIHFSSGPRGCYHPCMPWPRSGTKRKRSPPRKCRIRFACAW